MIETIIKIILKICYGAFLICLMPVALIMVLLFKLYLLGDKAVGGEA